MNTNRLTKSACLLPFMVAMILAGTTSSVRADTNGFKPLDTQPNNGVPLPPNEAIKHLRVPDGFKITLAASEPDVQQPIAIAFDDRGRLWVAESYSYNGSTFTDEPHDRVLIFEDTNGDGVFDKRRVFCDGLTHLTGLQIGFGGVWITAPPNLSFIPDHNHDDVPDGDAIIHLDGWSLKAEHNSVNGLTWGPDGWLYGRHGIKQPSSVGRPGASNDDRVELSCCIWRYHPKRLTFEVVADGTINPWGLDFDDHGQGFLTTSVVDHLWHLVPGARYQRWKESGVHPDPLVYEAMTSTNDHLHWGSASWEKSGKQASGVVDFGGGHSHCDAMIYLGDRWPESWRGSLFTSNIHGRRINCDRIATVNGEYRGEHADDFLVASDPWFRAVSMEYGPDGDVYVTDWSDNGECHDRDGIHRTSGRIYKITWGEPRSVVVDLLNAPTEQLVEYQLHRNDWYVRHARRILQERAMNGDRLPEAAMRLRKIFEENSDVTRKLRAMWALYSIDGVDEPWLVRQLSHEYEHVRAWTVRLLVDHNEPSAEAVAKFASMARDESSWVVRMALASALQRLAVGKRWEAAVGLASSHTESNTPNLERMLWYAIEPEIASDPQRAARILTEVSPRLRRWIARRITETSTPSTQFLFHELRSAAEPKAIADVIDGFNDALVTVNIEELPQVVAQTVTEFIAHQDARIRVASMTAAAAVGDEATLNRVRSRLHDASLALEIRRAALDGLLRRKPPGFGEDLKQLLERSELTEVVLKAATAINDAALQKSIVDRFSSLNKRDRVAAIDCLVARPSSAKMLIDAIEQKRIGAAELSASQARQIVSLNDKELLLRFEEVWGSARPTPADRLQLIKTWQRALDPSRIAKADLASGQALFQKTCGNCHKLFDEGRAIGPDLTGANRRNLNYMLSNVIDPSAAVPVDFQLTNVLTHDGQVVSGIISQRSKSAITIQTTADSIQIRTDEIDTVKVSSVSMMPDGLLDKLSEDQVRDLFAWAMSDGPAQLDNTTKPSSR